MRIKRLILFALLAVFVSKTAEGQDKASKSLTLTVSVTAKLSWSASASPLCSASVTTACVASYNVFRSTISGGSYVQIGTTGNATLAYVDATVVKGTTYYYVVEAIDTAGDRSSNSNQASIIVP